MNETLTVFMISEIERLREEGREPARRIYHNMLRTLRESAGKEEIGFEEVTPVFLGKYEHWLLGKRLSWNTVSTYMRALRAGYNRGRSLQNISVRNGRRPFPVKYPRYMRRRYVVLLPN